VPTTDVLAAAQIPDQPGEKAGMACFLTFWGNRFRFYLHLEGCPRDRFAVGGAARSSYEWPTRLLRIDLS
jgi:hypothetical protein